MEESLAASLLVSELVCKSAFNCGQIRGRENTKDLWGLQCCCKPEPLTCQQQILTSLYHLVLLSFVRGEEQKSVFRRVGMAGGTPMGTLPWVGRMDAACVKNYVELLAGKEERSLSAAWVSGTWSLILFCVNFWLYSQ